MLPFYTNEEIGKRLGIATRTVKYRTDRIKAKLGVKTRREIGRYLLEKGELF